MFSLTPYIQKMFSSGQNGFLFFSTLFLFKKQNQKPIITHAIVVGSLWEQN